MNWIRDLLGAIGAMLFAIALSLLSSEARSYISQNVELTVLLFIVSVSCVFVFTLWRHKKIAISSVSIPLDPEDLSTNTRMVFSTSKMSENLDEIYDKFFKSKHEMKQEEYHKIEDRKKFIRALVRSHSNRVEIDVIGYYSVFPIRRELFDDMRLGRFKESSIKDDVVLDPGDDRAKVLYVCEVCSTDQRSATQLIYDLKKFITRLARENRNIESIGAWGYTKSGRRLINAMGMTKLKSARRSKPYFEISTSTALQKLQRR